MKRVGRAKVREKDNLNAKKREELVHQEDSYLFGEDKMVNLKL